MFPISFNFPFRKSDGSLTTIEKATNFNFVGSAKSTDTDKSITIPKGTKTLLLSARRDSTSAYYSHHCDTVVSYDVFESATDGNSNRYFCFAESAVYISSGDLASAGVAGAAVIYDKVNKTITPYKFKIGSTEYDFELFVSVIE